MSMLLKVAATLTSSSTDATKTFLTTIKRISHPFTAQAFPYRRAVINNG